MMENGKVEGSELAKQEEFVKTRFNQLHDSLDKLDNWALTSGDLLESMLQIPDERLLRWQDGAKMLRLKKQNWMVHSQKMIMMPST